MAACEACGNEVVPGNAFCTRCGALLASPSSPRPGNGSSGSVPGECLTWERKIPLITNPYLVLQCLVIPIAIGFFLGMVFWLITGAPDMFTMFLLIGGGMAVIFILVMVVLEFATRGGLLTTFFISSEGVAHRAGSTTQGLDTIATVGSALAGSMAGTGAGLLAKSQECNVLEWADVRYISVYRRTQSIVFRSKYLISPVVLYCTDETFGPVLAMVQRYAPPAASAKL